MYGTEKDVKHVVSHITSKQQTEACSAAAAAGTWPLLGLVLEWAHREVYETPAALLA